MTTDRGKGIPMSCLKHLLEWRQLQNKWPYISLSYSY